MPGDDWVRWDYYRTDGSDNPPPTDDLGFMAAFYVRMDYSVEPSGVPLAWVISVRGTVPSNLDDIIGDIQLALGKVPMQVDRAIDYVSKEIKAIANDPYSEFVRKSISTVPIYVVGHSLGAVIASCVHSFIATENNLKRCVTFDNPGSSPVVKEFLKTRLGMSDPAAIEYMERYAPDVHNFLSDVDIINTCNQQWGANLYWIKHWKFDMDGKFPPNILNITSSYIANPHYLISYSLFDQHSITNICDAINNDQPIFVINDHPAGLAKGYHAYLDGEERQEYWEAYFKVCWDNDADLRNSYNNIYNNYNKAMFEVLKETRGISLLEEEDFVKQESVKFRMNNLFSLFKHKPETLVPSTESKDNYEFVSIEKGEVKCTNLSL